MLTGGCFCGALRYEAQGVPFHETICHCADCRRSAGAASVAWFSVARDALRFVAGAPSRFRSSPGVERSFCGRCGTGLTYASDRYPEEIDVALCSLDDPSALTPLDHVWTMQRPAWEALCDGRPVHARGRS